MDGKKTCLWTNGGFELCEDKIWFVPYWANGLCCFNMKTQLVDRWIDFPQLTTAFAGFFNLKKFDSLFVIIPAFERAIYFYDMNTDEMNVIPLERGRYSCEKFQECAELDGMLYLFPYDYDGIIKLNVINRDYIVLPTSVQEKKFCDSCRMQNIVYLVNRMNRLYMFDLCTEQFQIYEEQGEKCFRTVCTMDQDTLLITDEDSQIYTFHLKDHFFEEKTQKGIPANQSIVIEKNLYLFPLRANDTIVKIALDNGTSCPIAIRDQSHYKSWSSTATSKIKVFNQKIYMMNPNYQCICELDIRTNKLSSYFCTMEEWEEERCDYFYGLSKTDGVYKEGNEKFSSLEYFIAKMNRGPKSRVKEEEDIGTAGKEIYEMMKE